MRESEELARIRTIKPEFWVDEDNGALSRDARLLLLAILNIADDEGLLRWSAPYLKASAFLYDDDLTPERVYLLMQELEDGEYVYVYKGGRTHQPLAFIVNFRKHQKINRPQPSRLPPPSLQNRTTLEVYCRRDNWTCHLCGSPVNHEPAIPPVSFYSGDEEDLRGLNASPDHLVPRSAGGNDYPSNIRTAHRTCNLSRGSKPLDVNGSMNDSPPEGKGKSKSRETRSANADVVRIFDAWKATLNRPSAARLTADRRRVIQRALKDYPLAELEAAVRNWPKSAHHRGENDRGTVYNDVALILRDAQRIEYFRDIEERSLEQPLEA